MIRRAPTSTLLPYTTLLRPHRNLSQQRPTKCPCRNVLNAKVHKTKPIKDFICKSRRIMFRYSARTDPLYLFRTLLIIRDLLHALIPSESTKERSERHKTPKY